MLLAASVLIFTMITLVIVSLLTQTRGVENTVRLKEVRQEGGGGVVVRGTGLDNSLGEGFGKRLIKPRLKQASGWILGLAPHHVIEQGKIKLEQAGRDDLHSLSLFMLSKVVTTALFVFIAMWIMGKLPQPAMIKMALAGLTLLIGLILPDYVLTKIISARRAKIRRELPDVLDLLVVSTEAGAGLDAAMGTIIERKSGPLSDEFARFLSEVHFGKSREKAWDDMSERVELQELTTVISAIQQADKLGVSIARTLRNQSLGLRQRRSQQVREIIAKMPVKMLFPVVLCIFPALFVVILAPGLIAIATAFENL